MAGLAGVVVFGSLLIAASYAVVARFLLAPRRRSILHLRDQHGRGGHRRGALGGAAPSHHPARRRPAAVLPRAGRTAAWLWLLFLLFVVWANLHGGFVFGLTLLGIYLAGSLAEWRWGSDPALWKERSRYYALALLVAGLGTLMNPNGPALHLHIIRFFGEPFLRDNTEEFLSPDFHSVADRC